MQRVVWLTDIHINFLPAADVGTFLSTVAAAKPDVVLLGGDIAEAPDLLHYLTRIADALNALESVFPLQVKERGDAIELIPRG